MKCPYCVSDINSKALVCKSCKRDIFLPKQLLLRISYLEKQLQTSQTRKIEDSDLNTLSAAIHQPQVSLTSFAIFQATALDFFKFFIAPLLLLLLAHLCITIIYDTKILYLRLITLTLPMCFGFLLCKDQSRNNFVWIVWVVSLGLISVMAMSAMTSLVDDSPVWPQSIYEWRDMTEFAASISFSYLTGMFVGRLAFLKTNNALQTHTSSHRSEVWMVDTGDERTSQTSLQFIAKKFSEFITALGAMITTIIAIYTGLKGLF